MIVQRLLTRLNSSFIILLTRSTLSVGDCSWAPTRAGNYPPEARGKVSSQASAARGRGPGTAASVHSPAEEHQGARGRQDPAGGQGCALGRPHHENRVVHQRPAATSQWVPSSACGGSSHKMAPDRADLKSHAAHYLLTTSIHVFFTQMSVWMIHTSYTSMD